jgi:hypothetical protein
LEVEDGPVQPGSGEVALSRSPRREEVVGLRTVCDGIDRDADRVTAVGLVRVDLAGLVKQVGHPERVDRAHRPIRLPIIDDDPMARRRRGERVGGDDLTVRVERDKVTSCDSASPLKPRRRRSWPCGGPP